MTQPGLTTYYPGVPDRSGTRVYTILIRGPEDPSETMARGAGRDPTHWRKEKRTPAEVADVITEHLRELSAPATFNAICVRLTGATADVWHLSPLEEGLWLAVERGDVLWSNQSPPRFIHRSGVVFPPKQQELFP